MGTTTRLVVNQKYVLIHFGSYSEVKEPTRSVCFIVVGYSMLKDSRPIQSAQNIVMEDEFKSNAKDTLKRDCVMVYRFRS